MDYRTLFPQVRRRPEMYGVQNSFHSFCAFLQGVDAGNDWQLFTGFREFLALRAGFGTNLAWPGLILRLAFPEISSGVLDPLKDRGKERIAVDTLFRCLDEFLEQRAETNGTERIFEAYFATFRQAGKPPVQ
jgi:hypothetical protein